MAEAVSELFSYNRESFKFNAEIHQQDLFQRQKMRVRSVVLYREDLRDLFGLTIGRMDTYMIVNVLFMGICGEMYYKGRSPSNAPHWVFWLWSGSLSSAMFYLLLSLWLALHASVDAQTFMTRSLTQWLRLPVPSKREIDEATLHAEDFEKEGTHRFVKIPVAEERLGTSFANQSATAKEGTADYTKKQLAEEWDKFRQHFRVFNAVHKKWQSHEAYARVSSYLGTNQLLFSIAYFGLSYYGVSYNTPWLGWGITAMTTAVGLLHIRINMLIKQQEFFVIFALTLLPPLCACIAAGLENLFPSTIYGQSQSSRILGCASIACHAVLLGVYLWLAQGKSPSRLPIKFGTVWGIDVLGFDRNDGIHLPGLQAADMSCFKDDENLRKSLKSAESTLQQLFTQWQAKSSQMSDDQVASILALKEQFNSEKTEIKRMMISTLSEDINDSWIKLEYQPDSENNQTTPYYLNVDTGELSWDPPHNQHIDIKRGMSYIPEKLAEFRTASKAVCELKKEKRLLDDPERVTELSTVQPWELFRYGTIVIIIVWMGGFIVLLLSAIGISIY